MAAKGYKHNQSKYKETMPAQLIAMFTDGKDRCHFCSHHSIASETFDAWLAKHEEFAEAYKIAKSKAHAYMMNVAQEHLVEEFQGKKLNTTLWSMLMRNRFELTEHRKLKMEGLKKAKSFAEQMQVVMNELASGKLTANEAQQMSRLIETGVSVYESTELEKRLSEVERAGKIGVADSDFKEE